MANDALQTFIENVRSAWGPLSSQVVAACQRHLTTLLAAPDSEPWLAALHRDAPDARELYRDTDHGFVLLAHVEHQGLYRLPHDHGRGWVIYAVQRGTSEMATYLRVEGEAGRFQLVKRDTTTMGAGHVKVFLPGDIHDTRCMAEPTLLFRFTSRDLRKEDREEHRVNRYVESDGLWSGAVPGQVPVGPLPDHPSGSLSGVRPVIGRC